MDKPESTSRSKGASAEARKLTVVEKSAIAAAMIILLATVFAVKKCLDSRPDDSDDPKVVNKQPVDEDLSLRGVPIIGTDDSSNLSSDVLISYFEPDEDPKTVEESCRLLVSMDPVGDRNMYDEVQRLNLLYFKALSSGGKGFNPFLDSTAGVVAEACHLTRDYVAMGIFKKGLDQGDERVAILADEGFLKSCKDQYLGEYADDSPYGLDQAELEKWGQECRLLEPGDERDGCFLARIEESRRREENWVGVCYEESAKRAGIDIEELGVLVGIDKAQRMVVLYGEIFDPKFDSFRSGIAVSNYIDLLGSLDIDNPEILVVLGVENEAELKAKYIDPLGELLVDEDLMGRPSSNPYFDLGAVFGNLMEKFAD